MHVRRRIAAGILIACAVFFAGFVAGFFVCIHDEPVAKAMPESVAGPGDAPPEVRAGVMRSLASFQSYFTARDPQKIDSFMEGLFDRQGESLLLGTDEPHWMRSYSDVRGMFRADWIFWGDVRLNLNETIVGANGDTAWALTTGGVHWGDSARPIRFTSVLVRRDDRWLFREIHFNWDDRDKTTSELLHPDLYLHAIKIGIRKLTTKPYTPPARPER